MLVYRRVSGLLLRGLFALGLGAAGCGGAPAELPGDLPPAPSPGKPFHYALDQVLRLQHVQVRGTHNSYHVDTTSGTFDPWAYTHRPIYEQLDVLGIRQLELDVYLDDDSLTVQHVPGADAGTRCPELGDCLREVRRFSDAYPGHMPIFIQIEPKSDLAPEEMDHFFAVLESEIYAAFPKERVLTPDEVQGNFPTLRAALADHGWPLLGQLRGRIFFAFDTTGPIRTAYTHNLQDLHGRALFVDSAPTDPFAGVSVLNDQLDPGDAAATKLALAGNLLIRTRADSDGDEARAGDSRRGMAGLTSGAHFISTDFPEPTATIPYRFQVPGGTPARCNPVLAPANCTAQALEDPAFVGSTPPTSP